MEKLSDIGVKVDMIFSSADLSFTKRHSPIKLTDKGQKYFKELDIEAIINSNWSEWSQGFKSTLSTYSKPNAYDVQKVCFEMFNKFFEKINNDELQRIKAHAYSKGLDILLYDSLFKIPVRDKVLEELNLQASDIDKYEPK